MTTAVLVKE